MRLIIGMSGSSGVIYGIRMLEMLAACDGIETHLILSSAARMNIGIETDWKVEDVEALADVVHNNKNIGASIASGSFKSLGMLIAPCSIRTLGEITSGVTSSLLTRSADVALKERRRLILMVRETPFHLGHLQNMVTATQMGAVIAPPLPAFYANPKTIDDIVDHSVGRALDLFDLDAPNTHRWTES